MRRKALRIVLWTVFLAAAGFGGWLVVRPTPVPCDVARAERATLVVVVAEDGRTRLKERYVVSAPLGGVMERIALKPGDAVDRDSTALTRIAAADPALLDERAHAQAQALVRVREAAVTRAETDVSRAMAELAHVEEEFKRMSAAAELGAVSPFEFENERVLLSTTRDALETARFARAMAQYELEQARAALLQHAIAGEGGDGTQGRALAIRPPISGKILRVIRESGGAVSTGDQLVEVGSLDELEIEVDVLSDQAVRVRPRQRVVIDRWGGERPLAGVVRKVEPSGFMKVSALGVEEQRVNVIVDFIDPREARPTLGDGFRVEASIVVLEKPDVLCVPVGALVRSGGSWAVFVVEQGVSHLRTVKVGERSGQLAEIAEGLRDGESVVVFPSDRVTDGGRVRPRG